MASGTDIKYFPSFSGDDNGGDNGENWPNREDHKPPKEAKDIKDEDDEEDEEDEEEEVEKDKSTKMAHSAKTVRGRRRPCLYEGCDQPAQSGGPWFCSIDHYRLGTPLHLQRICDWHDCNNVVMKGKKCQSHVTRRTGLVAERKRIGDRRKKEFRENKEKKLANKK